MYVFSKSLSKLVMSTLANINFVTLILKRKLLGQILENLAEVDSRMEKLGCRPTYPVNKGFLYFAAVCIFFIFCCFSYIMGLSVILQIDDLHLIITVCNTLATVHLTSSLFNVARTQFQLLRVSLKRSVGLKRRMILLADLHRRVLFSCHLLNDVFAKQMIAIILTAVFYVILNSHYLLDLVHSVEMFKAKVITALRVLWTFLYLCFGYVVISAGVRVRDEVSPSFDRMLEYYIL